MQSDFTALTNSNVVYEVIFVDDGSTDGTTTELSRIQKDKNNHRYIVHIGENSQVHQFFSALTMRKAK